VLAKGPGAEMSRSLGSAVFFGMLGVTVFGLLFTPIFYVLCRGLAARIPHAPSKADLANREGEDRTPASNGALPAPTAPRTGEAA